MAYGIEWFNINESSDSDCGFVQAIATYSEK